LVGESGTTRRGGRIEVMVCILRNADPDHGMDGLTQVCRLTSSQFGLYRNFLVGAGLLQVSKREDKVEVLEMTSKGQEFLKKYREIEGLRGF